MLHFAFNRLSEARASWWRAWFIAVWLVAMPITASAEGKAVAGVEGPPIVWDMEPERLIPDDPLCQEARTAGLTLPSGCRCGDAAECASGSCALVPEVVAPEGRCSSRCPAGCPDDLVCLVPGNGGAATCGVEESAVAEGETSAEADTGRSLVGDGGAAAEESGDRPRACGLLRASRWRISQLGRVTARGVSSTCEWRYPGWSVAGGSGLPFFAHAGLSYWLHENYSIDMIAMSIILFNFAVLSQTIHLTISESKGQKHALLLSGSFAAILALEGDPQPFSGGGSIGYGLRSSDGTEFRITVGALYGPRNQFGATFNSMVDTFGTDEWVLLPDIRLTWLARLF